jgi:hypothetical protein
MVDDPDAHHCNNHEGDPVTHADPAPDTVHWHVFAELADGTGTRAFPECLTEQQARDLAHTLAAVDGAEVWDAAWVHACPVGTRCTFWGLSATFDPDTAAPVWGLIR